MRAEQGTLDVLSERERIRGMDNSRNITEDTVCVEDYLRGCVGFEVNDNAITSILIDREIKPETPVHDLDKRLKDLCRADLYMWCASTPSTTGSVEDSDGGWKHKEGGSQSSAYDKRNLRVMANDIYKRYGENVSKSTIKLNPRGMRLWRRK